MHIENTTAHTKIELDRGIQIPSQSRTVFRLNKTGEENGKWRLKKGN